MSSMSLSRICTLVQQVDFSSLAFTNVHVLLHRRFSEVAGAIISQIILTTTSHFSSSSDGSCDGDLEALAAANRPVEKRAKDDEKYN